jgi:drug/metabolite transporter (DMT)-like permease
MSVIWGLPYLFIRIAVEYLTPGTLVFFRTAGAAVVLLPLALARSQVLPVLARWRPLALFAVIEVMIPWLLLSDAERKLSSSLTGLLVAAVPLVGALLARFSSPADRATVSQLAGLLLGIVGVTALVGLDFGGLSLFAFAEMAVVSVCYAVGPIVLARSLADLPSSAVIAVSMALSAVCYLPFLLLQPPRQLPASAVASLVVLSLVCTALAFLLFFELIATIGPARATVITYVNPAVAIALGVLVLNEDLTAGMLIGFPLILAGSILAARRSRVAAARRSGEVTPVAAA